MTKLLPTCQLSQGMSPRSRLMAAQAHERQKGCGQAPTRVELMLAQHAESEQEKIVRRAQREAQEVAGCTFKPQLRRPRSAPRIVSSGTTALSPPFLQQETWHLQGNSRCAPTAAHDVLYARALTQRRMQGERIAKMEECRSREELEPCTFKPDTGRSSQSYRRALSARSASGTYPRGFDESRQRLRTARASRDEALQMHEERLGRLRPVDTDVSASLSMGPSCGSKKASGPADGTQPSNAFEKIRNAAFQDEKRSIARVAEMPRRNLSAQLMQSAHGEQDPLSHVVHDSASSSHQEAWKPSRQPTFGTTSQTAFHEFRHSNMYSAVDEAVAIANALDANSIRESPTLSCDQDGLPASYLRLWRCEPCNGLKLGVRSLPAIDGPMAGDVLQPGDVFPVFQELKSADGVVYLQIAMGSGGWVFDHKPGVGTMCVRHEVVERVDLNETFGNVADSSFDVAGDDRHSSSSQKTLLNLEVRVQAGEPTVALIYKEGDNVAAVASEFARRHRLSDQLAEKFYNLLEQQLLLLRQKTL